MYVIKGEYMNKKKIKKITILLILIITILGVGSLLAFLTDTDTETNVFTVGKVDIELVEPNWILNKIDVLNGIYKELNRRNTYQGIRKNSIQINE